MERLKLVLAAERGWPGEFSVTTRERARNMSGRPREAQRGGGLLA
jgi:hypothetical protein